MYTHKTVVFISNAIFFYFAHHLILSHFTCFRQLIINFVWADVMVLTFIMQNTNRSGFWYPLILFMITIPWYILWCIIFCYILCEHKNDLDVTWHLPKSWFDVVVALVGLYVEHEYGSVLGRVISCPDWDFSWFYFSLLRQMWVVGQATTASK